MQVLTEKLTWDQAKVQVEESIERQADGRAKDLYMRGVFIEGDIKNHNNRVYPVKEIASAVRQLDEAIKNGETIWGEADHPEELTINLDRVSHMVTEMRLINNQGIGKLKIVPTPMGNIVRTLIECGGKLGVSSRGTGNVNDRGIVSEFEIVTVDIVARPSAPHAYPTPIYERFMNARRSGRIEALAEAVRHDPKAQKHLTSEVLKIMDEFFKV